MKGRVFYLDSPDIVKNRKSERFLKILSECQFDVDAIISRVINERARLNNG